MNKMPLLIKPSVKNSHFKTLLATILFFILQTVRVTAATSNYYELQDASEFDMGYEIWASYGGFKAYAQKMFANMAESKCYVFPVSNKSRGFALQVRDYSNKLVRNIPLSSNAIRIFKLDKDKVFVTGLNGDMPAMVNINGVVYWEKAFPLYNGNTKGKQWYEDAILGADNYLYVFGVYQQTSAKPTQDIFVKKIDMDGNQIQETTILTDDYAEVVNVTLQPGGNMVNVYFTTGIYPTVSLNCQEINLNTFSVGGVRLNELVQRSAHYDTKVYNNTDMLVITGIYDGQIGKTIGYNYLTGFTNGSQTPTITQKLNDEQIESEYLSAQYIGGDILSNGNFVYLYNGKTSNPTEPRLYIKEFDKNLNIVNESILNEYLFKSRDNVCGVFVDDKNCINVLIAVGEINANGGLMYKKIRTYKFRPPIRTATISTTASNIGDNTHVMIDVNTIGPYAYLNVHDVTNNVGIWSGVAQATARLDLDLDLEFEGDKSIIVQMLDTDRSILSTSNVLTLNKRNVLNKAYSTASNKTGLQNFIVIDDVDRYFENNSANQKLVADIKAKAAGTFLIYNDVCDVLIPLLKT